MTVYLVRHGVARKRSAWHGSDADRPLNHRGERQAHELKRVLGDRHITRVLSSPTVRCVDTVEPLANHLGLAVAHHAALVEGATTAAALDLLGTVQEDDEGDVVLCSHGDVIPRVLRALADGGAKLKGPSEPRKGSTWVLEADGERFVRGRYLPPPA